MTKIDRVVLKIFLYGLPLAIGLAIFFSCFDSRTIETEPDAVRSLYNLSGLIFAVWILLSVFVSLRLVFSKILRNEILPKLIFFRERDEREVQLSGRATRNSFLIMLAISICLLCLSIFTVSVYRIPPDQAINGKTCKISLGLSLNLLAKPNETNTAHEPVAVNYFTYTGLPITNIAILLFLILWQTVSYNYLIRRSANEQDG
jgi:hypothetical protein